MGQKPPHGLAVGQPLPRALGMALFWVRPCCRPAADNSGSVKCGQEASPRLSQ